MEAVETSSAENRDIPQDMHLGLAQRCSVTLKVIAAGCRESEDSACVDQPRKEEEIRAGIEVVPDSDSEL